MSDYRSLFDNSVVGIFETTSEGRILAVNPWFASILGFSSPEALISSNVRGVRDDTGELVGLEGFVIEDIVTWSTELFRVYGLTQREFEASYEDRIARELHDGLGQTLASISLFAKELEEDIPAAYSGRLAGPRKIAEDAIVGIRAMVRNLGPVELDKRTRGDTLGPTPSRVSAVGGAVMVGSRPGSGTSVRVRIPRDGGVT